MGEVKWTPGPWYPGHMVDDDHSCNCTGITEEGYAGGIASIHVDNGISMISEGGNDCPPIDEAKANAFLIASAPSLYEVLDEAADYIAGIPEHDVGLMSKITLALRFARGEWRPK